MTLDICPETKAGLATEMVCTHLFEVDPVVPSSLIRDPYQPIVKSVIHLQSRGQ